MLTLLSTLALFSSTFAQNPFQGALLYSNSYWQDEVQVAIGDYPNDAASMRVAQNQSVFFWLDSMARISNLSVVLDGATSLASSSNSPVVVGIIIYDLPDRYVHKKFKFIQIIKKKNILPNVFLFFFNFIQKMHDRIETQRFLYNLYCCFFLLL